MKRLELSPRLRMVASLIPAGARLADVGTDHAYLPVALILEGKIPWAVAADLKYNQFLDARAMGLNLMDAGHFPTENVVCAPLAVRLKEAFPDVEVRLSKVHKEIYGAV